MFMVMYIIISRILTNKEYKHINSDYSVKKSAQCYMFSSKI